MEWAKKFNFNRRSAIGDFLEPAISNANTIIQTILGPPFVWRWNRVVTGFICVPNQQDYYLFNWKESTAVQLGWMTVDTNGNCQTVTTAGTTGSSLPTWSTGQGATTTDNTITWTNLGPIGTSTSSTYNFGWIEESSVKDTNSKWVEMSSQISLALASETGRPRFVSAQSDDGSGNIVFRLMPTPDKAYPISLTIQQKAPVFSSVNQTWNPIPDEYSRLYDWGFLSLFWLFADDPRFQLGNQKFITQLLSTNEGLTETERNIFLGNWEYITGTPIINQVRSTQGEQARGV